MLQVTKTVTSVPELKFPRKHSLKQKSQVSAVYLRVWYPGSRGEGKDWGQAKEKADIRKCIARPATVFGWADHVVSLDIFREAIQSNCVNAPTIWWKEIKRHYTLAPISHSPPQRAPLLMDPLGPSYHRKIFDLWLWFLAYTSQNPRSFLWLTWQIYCVLMRELLVAPTQLQVEAGSQKDQALIRGLEILALSPNI